jgi:hypothetical protein
MQSVSFTGVTSNAMTGCRGGSGTLQDYSEVITGSFAGTNKPVPQLNQGFPISDQLALFLGASGAKTTRVFKTGTSL